MPKLHRFVIVAKFANGKRLYMGKDHWYNKKDSAKVKKYTSNWWPRYKIIPKLEEADKGTKFDVIDITKE